MTAEMERCNIFATAPEHPRPEVVLSTHMDTVPAVHSVLGGRPTTSMGGVRATPRALSRPKVAAASGCVQKGIYVGLLFLVGEERDSLGQKSANEKPVGNKYLINGEPTENKVAVASKGAMRAEVTARGKMAHSAYPELGSGD